MDMAVKPIVETEELIQIENLEHIITDRLITPVFQPIISFRDGKVLGYEALSRIKEEGLFQQVEAMFQCAEKHHMIWSLEQVCRRSVLQKISEQKELFEKCGAKLFMNVNPWVLYDEKFKAGFTREYTKRYGISSEKIVFEITERERIENEKAFLEAIEHYKIQDYQIAIDDVGAGYSGLNRICNLSPNYIKLDVELVRAVYKNPMKYAMIKGLVEFSQNSGTMLIAEGVEDQRELEMLIDLGVMYGQGFYLARPAAELGFCREEACEIIRKRNRQKNMSNHLGAERFCIRNIASPGLTVAPYVKVENMLPYVEKNESIIGICVVDSKDRPQGILTRERLLKRLGGRYGFSLNHNKEIGEIADTSFLQVEAYASISNVARIAMEREHESLYDFIVVKEDGKYYGVVTMQELLKRAMEIDVNLAKSSSPLTGLPGNVVIDQEIREHLASGEPCTFYYFDLDNFKAFNDVYGFEKGDEVIRIMAEVLKGRADGENFVGHIGGDDFVMIVKGYQRDEFSRQIVTEFEEKSHLLYSGEDRQRQFIVSRNRQGNIERFPLVSVTIAALSNEYEPFGTQEEVVDYLAARKKAAKMNK